MLFRKSLRKFVMDVKVIPGEEVALQHQLLVCDMMIDMPPQIKRKFTPFPKMWKLRYPQTCSRFQEVFKAHVPAVETEQQSHTDGDVKLGGGIRKLIMPSQPSFQSMEGWQMHTSIIYHCQAHLQTCGAPCTPRSRQGGL